MQIGPHVEALQRDLIAVAAAGGAEQSDAVRRLAAALESSLRLRLLEVVTEAAHELTSQLSSAHVDVRLAGGDASLTYVDDAPASEPAVPEDAFTARITLRLPEALKATVEAAAAREGMSVNAWLVQTIARAVQPSSRSPRSNRITGFAQS